MIGTYLKTMIAQQATRDQVTYLETRANLILATLDSPLSNCAISSQTPLKNPPTQAKCLWPQVDHSIWSQPYLYTKCFLLWLP